MPAVTISDQAKKVAEQVQRSKKLETLGEAVDFLFGVAVSRLNALRKYANKGKVKKPAKPKAKPKAKRAAKPKAAPAPAAPSTASA